MSFTGVISGLFVHPIKGCRGVAVDAADVERRGLRGDRRYMLVDEARRFVTQREEPRLALVDVTQSPRGFTLSFRGRSTEIPREASGARRVTVEVWGSEVAAAVEPGASRWFSEILGRPLQLAFMPDDVERAIDPDYATSGEIVSFADAFPLLLVGQASLDELNRRLPIPLEMRRFRPNLVFSGAPAFAEDELVRVRAGAVLIRLVKPCSRCVVTTIDPETAEAGREPLATLAAFRRRDGAVYFGMNAIPESTGRIAVGMTLEVAS
jgi:MOSC domain-containing protein